MLYYVLLCIFVYKIIYLDLNKPVPCEQVFLLKAKSTVHSHFVNEVMRNNIDQLRHWLKYIVDA